MVIKLVFLNIICFLLTIVLTNYFNLPIFSNFAVYPLYSENFHFYQLFTSLFLHGNISHLVFNMFFLITFGKDVEKTMKQNEFLLLYLTIGLFATLTQLSFTDGSLIGASGAISGVIIYYTLLYPDTTLINNKLKLKYFVWGDLFLELLQATINRSGDHVGHWAHLGGALTGLSLFYFIKSFNQQTIETN